MRQSDQQIKFVYYNPFRDLALVEKYWKILLRKCGHEYFLSWGWISTWIKSLETKTDICFVVGLIQGEPVLGFFMGISSKRKYGIFRTKLISLNTSGIPYFDQLFLEYNRILVDDTVQFGTQELMQILAEITWDELILPGLAFDFANDAGLVNSPSTNPFRVLIDEQSPAFLVDLEQVRKIEMDYLRLVSSNKRSQIRRSIKEYEKDGEIELVEAVNVDEALGYFDELVELHQKEWANRGRAGAFSNKYLFRFHMDLIASRFMFGEIQILKCFTPNATIGILYNFIYDGKVYFYQSGFNYPSGNIYRPGLVSHYYAICHNAQKGRSIYDFMAGEASYKSSLASESQSMYWIRLFRHPFHYYLEYNIRQIKSWVKSKPGLIDWTRKMKDIFRQTENL